MNLLHYIPTAALRRVLVEAAKAFARDTLNSMFEQILAEHGEVTVETVLAEVNERVNVPVLSEAQEDWVFRTFFSVAAEDLIVWWALERPQDEAPVAVGYTHEDELVENPETIPEGATFLGVFPKSAVVPSESAPDPNAPPTGEGDGTGEGESKPE